MKIARNPENRKCEIIYYKIYNLKHNVNLTLQISLSYSFFKIPIALHSPIQDHVICVIKTYICRYFKCQSPLSDVN